MKCSLVKSWGRVAFILVLTSINVLAGDIVKINFKQNSDYKFQRQQLEFNIQSRVGQKFSQKVLDSDVKRLFSTGMFSDVTADTEKDEIGDVTITFTVAPKAIVSKVEIVGNKKFSGDELRKEITLFAQNPLNDKLLRESTANIRKFYKGKGYQDATVVPRILKDANGKVIVRFDIKEHLKQKVNDVIFEGATVFSQWRLKHSVETQYSIFSWLFDTGLFVRDDLARDKQTLREMYLEKGYLDFEVKDIKVVETEDPEYVNVTFVLDEGKPYKIGKVTISGNKSVPNAVLDARLRLKSGETYNSVLERKDVAFLDRKYGSLGYADFRCKVVRTPDYSTHIVDVNYKITEGSVYHVRKINITGNKITKDYVIRREIKLQPGDVMNQTRLQKDKQRIMNLRIFKKVDAVTVNAGKNKKDVDITVKEDKTMHLKLGAGFSDSDSAMAMVELSETNFDISDPSNYFRGGGQTMRARAMLGHRGNSFSIDFTEPYLFDKPIGLNVKAYRHESYYDDWDETRTGVSSTISKREFLNDEFNTVSLGLRFEQVEISDMDDDMSQIFQDEEGSDQISAISLSFNRDTRDSHVEPTKGYELNLFTEYNAEALGASEEFYKVELKASKYYSFLDDSVVLHTGAKAGIVDTTGGGTVPMYERYFLGGGDTVRGFEYRDISPVDRNDDAYGGDSMFLANIELMHPLYESIKGAVFVDAGTVGEEASDFDFDDLSVGAGYGLRIKVPQFGAPLKLDLAYPIVRGRDHLERKLRFHFNMGFDW